MLSNDVLLEIFDFYKEDDDYDFDVWNWDILVHVCRRWRQVVFESPFRLDLRIVYTSRTPVMKNLGIWPALPIVIHRRITTDDEDNIIAAPEHVDCVCDIKLSVMVSELERITTAMQKPFPVLTSLFIHTRDLYAPVLPAEVLGRSAPCLQEIY